MDETQADGGTHLGSTLRRDLHYLRTGNADEKFTGDDGVTAPSEEPASRFEVVTKLDSLEERLFADQAPTPRLILLVAQAGDGKTHFFHRLSKRVAREKKAPVRFFWKDTGEASEPSHVDGGMPDWRPDGKDLEHDLENNPERLFEQDEDGWWFVNDPSQSGPEHAGAFLDHAWHDLANDRTRRRYLFGINRGKLREFLHDDSWPSHGSDDSVNENLQEWLSRAAALHPSVHRLQPFVETAESRTGRLVVPLDHRVLVPSPGTSVSAGESAVAHRAAEKIFDTCHRHDERLLTEVDGLDLARAAAVILGLVEASGIHVTFRQIQNYCAYVVDSMHKADNDDTRRRRALQALFLEDYDSGAAERMADIGRRLDPARIAHPEIDCDAKSARERDFRVRREALKELTDAFEDATSEDHDRQLRIPYASAADYLTICRQLADQRKAHVAARRDLDEVQVPDLATNGTPTDDLERLHQTLRQVELPLYESQDEEGVRGRGWLVPSAEGFFRGLSRLAWGSTGSDADPRTHSDTTEVLPLAAPMHPGDRAGTATWRALRAAVGRERLVVRTDVVDTGDYIEDGLQRPELVVRGSESGPDDSPGLPLTLELYEALCRYGRERGISQGRLGPVADRVNDWLDALVAEWHDTLVDDRNDFVVYQTLVGPDSRPRHVPLRGSERGTRVKVSSVGDTNAERSIHHTLRELWPAAGSGGGGEETFAVTPAACASALLHWAGCRPAEARDETTTGADPMMRELLGARAHDKLRGRSTYHSPAFPWSVDMLTTTYRLGHGTELWRSGVDDPNWASLAHKLGAKCAEALGLDEDGNADRWRAGLRATWSRDEEAFDTHPAARLAHQLLGLGVGGHQLADVESRPIGAENGTEDPRTRILRRLLDASAPVPPTERWWLIGNWAAWWLFLGAICEVESERSVALDNQPPIWIPRAPSVESRFSIASKHIWLNDDSEDDSVREAIAAVGQASGFLQGPNRRKHFQFRLEDAVLTLVRLVAHDYVQCAHADGEMAVFDEFRQKLERIGIFAGRTDTTIDFSGHPGLKHWSIKKDSLLEPVENLLEQKLNQLALLDRQEASDGPSFVRDPWPGD